MKKILILILCCILMSVILIGCEDSQNTNNSGKNISADEINSISGELGENEILQEVSTKNREIDLKFNLGNKTDRLTMEDLAYSRYSSVTDYLLNTGKWDVITVDFINVGKITMNISEAVSQNISGKEEKHFPLETIMKKFQKY
ncbi:ABC-type Fe3+-hydroxamate transport system substrate-binding protein [Clostridium algifaecis]|uniref:ABC-type Fe3+-hydroxamate transport system substrate-binding protein n=1 Tax=Clostridium algifaecis TaxID=1472040 RepID=A0ABS4KRC9_9CLOT|nr:hypothetical protein [Clostridium algifaecis]MBP2032579.1 ABC-type Fe3+-hydroxamate transport system substrate-binding protein [Clostridium algifaecis]